jgi:hypothetical protein
MDKFALVLFSLLSLPLRLAAAEETVPISPTASGLAINLDLGTLAGVLGVILTVVFFIIGYRQTIGAKKERAAGADRDISETLLRRLTLETDFSINCAGIERFISGKAIESRVKRSDLLSTDELWALLYSHVVSSDYVAAKLRKPMLDKIDESFKPTSGDVETLFLKSAEEAPTRARDARQLYFLGGLSSLMAGILVALAARVVAGEWSDGLGVSARLPILLGIILSIATSLSLIFFYWLKEKAAATRQDSEIPRGEIYAHEFERRFTQRLKATGIEFTPQREIDLLLTIKNRRVAVELKLNTPSPRFVKSLVTRMTDLLARMECDEAYLVFASSIPNRLRDLSTDKVKILTADEFFRILTEPEPLRAGPNLGSG